MTVLRSSAELKRAQWAEKYLSVTEGKLYEYADPACSPFPIHEYIKIKLLGAKQRLVELNAGATLVEQMVADTVTTLKIQVGDKPGSDEEKQILEWHDSIDYIEKLEEAARDFYGTGYCVQQPIRTIDGNENGFTACNVDPSTWYPTLPIFDYQYLEEAKIISVFDEGEGGLKKWYAFVERHEAGTVTYELYELERADALEGNKVSLGKIARFAGIAEVSQTDLDYLAVFQRNRKKTSRNVYGQSVLAPVWDLLQEVTEIQTQIRQERIKHFKSKLYVPRRSLKGAENVADVTVPTQPVNSKTTRTGAGTYYDANQEIFPIDDGNTVPGYIQRDLQTITLGSQEIDKLLSRIAAITGCPKRIFNLEDKAGNVKVDIEKRSDRRYVSQILQGQRKMASLAWDVTQTWWRWNNGEELPDLKVSLVSPFDLTQEERVTLMREMNADAKFVSQDEAVKEIWADKTPEELDALIAQIQQEADAATAAAAVSLRNPQPVQLP